MSVPTFAGPVGPPWFCDMCAGWLASLHRKGRRPKTLIAYLFELRPWGRWLEQQAIVDAHQLTGGDMDRWQDFRAGVIAPGTQQLAAAAVRGLLRWAAMQEPPLCPPTLWLHVSTPRLAPRLPRPIPRADLERVLASFSGLTADLVRLRTRALFLLILSSGARFTEALSLDRGQFRNRTATVIQKGGGEKLLVISCAAEVAIGDYVAARTDSCPALFVNHMLRRPTDRLGHRGVQDGWDHLCAEVAIARFVSHQIRHTCATELLRQDVNPLTIAKHLGHHGLANIARYAEVGLETRHEMMAVLDERIRRAS